MNIKLYYAICIALRLFIATLVYFLYKTNYRLIFVIFYLLASLGSLYLFFFKIRQNGAFNQTIWWNFLRPIHSILFFIISLLLYLKYEYTYLIIIFDTLIGIPFHIIKRYL